MENNTNPVSQSLTRDEKIEDITGKNCPMTIAMRIIGGKWKLILLNHIRYECPMRFGELRKRTPYISQAILTAALRELEADGVLERTSYPETPPRVEYRLTPLGKELIPVMNALCKWGELYKQTQ